jgi:hypothetical protein
MHAAVRPHAATGAALLAASAIAVSPMAPPLPQAQATIQHAVSSAGVQLSALENPLVVFGDILGETLNNVGTVAGTVLADPAPILGQVATNQLGSAKAVANILGELTTATGSTLGMIPEQLQTAIGQLQAGQLTDALNTIVGIPLQLLIGPVLSTNVLADVQALVRQPVANLLQVIDAAPNALLFVTAPDGTLEAGVGLAAVAAISNVVNAVGNGAQNFVGAVETRNLENVANSITDGVAGVTKASLDGLFAPNDPTGNSSAGLIAGLLNTRDAIAKALVPAATTATAATTLKAETPRAVAAAPKTESSESDASSKDSSTGTDGTGGSAASGSTKPAKSDAGARHRAHRDNSASPAVKKFRDAVKKASGESRHAKAGAGSAK